MDEKLNRRQYVQLCGAALVVGVAGCTDSGDNNTESAGDNPDTDDNTNSDDGTSGNETDEISGDEPDDDTSDTDEDEGGDSDDGDEDEAETAPRLEDVFNWTDSYVMAIESDEFEGTWRFNDRNWQFTTTTDGQTSETYSIRTDSGRVTYVISQGQCFKTERTNQTEDRFDPEEPVDDDQEYVATGQTTIDGKRVYEFEIEEGVYYVSVETGYPVRYEFTDGGTVEFHSWGETEPITAPEMECTEQ